MNNDQSTVECPETQPLPEMRGGWWTIPEACIWIATRDTRLARDSEKARRSLFIADELAAAKSDRLEGPPLWLSVFDVRVLLERAFERNDLLITGRLRGEGSQVAIAPMAWAHLELTEHRENVIARAPSFDPFADWWDTLRVDAEAVRARWPWSEHPATLRHGDGQHRGDGLHDDAEMWLADVWRWCLFKKATLEDNGPSRVVWRELGNWVERRLFNAFMVGDLECLARLDPEVRAWSIVPQDWFRLKVELAPAANKLQPHSDADMADFGAAWETVRLATDFRVNVKAVRTWWTKVAAAAQASSLPADPAAPEMKATDAAPGPEEVTSETIAAWVAPIIEKIKLDRLRLTKKQFREMVEDRFRVKTKTLWEAWAKAPTEEWRVEGLGAVKVNERVVDWRVYRNEKSK